MELETESEGADQIASTVGRRELGGLGIRQILTTDRPKQLFFLSKNEFKTALAINSVDRKEIKCKLNKAFDHTMNKINTNE